MADAKSFSCADCAVHACRDEHGAFPELCLTRTTDADIFETAADKYLNDPQDAAMFRAAAEVEGYYKGTLTRVEEICLFAEKIGAKRIGIANCLGLASEARLFAKVLRAKGFEDVHAITCKVGNRDKTEVGVPDGAKCLPGNFEAACNPVAQAMILNELGTDLNVIVGLCVGHDSLFIKYSEAPVTYLVVKDRVTGHNPAATLYNATSFYKRIMAPGYPAPNHE